MKNNEHDATVHARLFSSIQTLYNKGFLQYFVTLRHRSCYGRVATAWSNDYFKCCELGMVSQNSTTMAVIGRAPTTPLAYICTVLKILKQFVLSLLQDLWPLGNGTRINCNSISKDFIISHLIYRVRQKKWTPKVFRHFLSNRLRF